jgi:hypothetical protein
VPAFVPLDPRHLQRPEGWEEWTPAEQAALYSSIKATHCPGWPADPCADIPLDHPQRREIERALALHFPRLQAERMAAPGRPAVR